MLGLLKCNAVMLHRRAFSFQIHRIWIKIFNPYRMFKYESLFFCRISVESIQQEWNQLCLDKRVTCYARQKVNRWTMLSFSAFVRSDSVLIQLYSYGTGEGLSVSDRKGARDSCSTLHSCSSFVLWATCDSSLAPCWLRLCSGSTIFTFLKRKQLWLDVSDHEVLSRTCCFIMFHVIVSFWLQ